MKSAAIDRRIDRRPVDEWRRWMVAGLGILLAVGSLLGCGGGGDGTTVIVAPTGAAVPGVPAGGGTIAGVVTGSGSLVLSLRAAAGLPPVEVWLQDLPQIVTRTDADGRFVLAGVPLGVAHRVVCRYRDVSGRVNLMTRSAPVVLTDAQPTLDAGVLPLAEARNRVTGVLRDPSGSPLPFASLTLWGMTFRADAEGRFETPPLPDSADREIVLVQASGFRPLAITMPFVANAVPPSLEVTVAENAEPNQPPLVFFASGVATIDAGGSVELRVEVIDPDELSAVVLTPVWSCSVGTLTVSPDARVARWQAPPDPGLASVSVRVTDSRRAAAAAHLTIAVGGHRLVVPRVTAVEPSSGAVGTRVRISGANFGGYASSSAVLFNGLVASIESWTDDTITAIVPPGAVTGMLVVTTATVDRAVGVFPIVDSTLQVSPGFGPVGTRLRITGSDFGTRSGDDAVWVNGVAAIIDAWTDREIAATVATGTTGGVVNLRVRERERTAGTFAVSRVFSVSAAAGTTDTIVRIDGEGFGALDSDSAASFGGGSAVIASWSPDQILLRVPSGAVDGPLTLWPGRVPLQVTPGFRVTAIASVAPDGATRGDLVEIRGVGFGASAEGAEVRFGETRATEIASWSDRSLTVRVPTGARPGPITVQARGIRSNPVDFTVIAIDRVSFPRAVPETPLVIEGCGFGTGFGRVLIGETPVTAFQSWTPDRVQFTVPPNAAPGLATLTVEFEGRRATHAPFWVSKLDAADPMVGWFGREIAITGSSLGSEPLTNRVRFGAVFAPVLSWADDRVVVRVPLTAASGPLIVDFSGASADLGEFEVVRQYPYREEARFGGPRRSSRPRLFGVAATPAGTLLVADADNNWIWWYDATGRLLGRTGATGYGDAQFDGLRGIAVAPDGGLWAADSGNHRVMRFDASGDYRGFIGQADTGTTGWHTAGAGVTGQAGAAHGAFNTPNGVIVDRAGSVWVADTMNHRVQKLGDDGAALLAFGVQGTGDGQFNQPSGLAVGDDGVIYVADTQNHRIQVFAADGTFQHWIGRDDANATGTHAPGSGRRGSKGGGPGEFEQPYDICLDGQGHLLIADALNHRVQILTTGGDFVGEIGQFGQNSGQFDGPTAVTVTASGVWVADTYNARVQLIKTSGEVQAVIAPDTGGLSTLAGRSAVDSGRRLLYVVDGDDGAVNVFTTAGRFVRQLGSAGSGPGQFKRPTGVAVDASGRVFVVDAENARVQRFDADGLLQKVWGVYGTGPGQFRAPEGIAVDRAGTAVFVVDRENGRVQKFDADGRYLLSVGRPGDGDGEFARPGGVAWSADGVLYVTDERQHRVQAFRADGSFLGWFGRDDLDVTGWHQPAFNRFGAIGNGEGQFDRPIDVAVDAEGNIYVVEAGNRRLQRFAAVSPTAPVAAVQATVESPAGFFGVAIDDGGALFLINADSETEVHVPDL